MAGTLTRDVKQAWRVVVRNPWSSALAVLLLAVGIGANGAVFSLVNAVLLEELPAREPQRLVWFTQPTFSYRQFDELRQRMQSFEGVVAWSPQTLNVIWNNRGEKTAALVVSGDFFSELGLTPALGRALAPPDDRPQADTAVMLSHGAWRRRFNGSPAAVGQTVMIDRVPFTIVGVMPESFHSVAVGHDPELVVTVHTFVQSRPSGREPFLEVAAYTWLHMLGRLGSGVTADAAAAELVVKWPQLLADIVSPRAPAAARDRFVKRPIGIAPAATGYSPLRREFSRPLLLLTGLVALLLLAGCANIANVLLARASLRRSELAVRLALGAGPRSLFTQLLSEAAMLAGAGTVLGLLLAWLGARQIVGVVSTAANPVELFVAPDWRVLLFSAALALFAALACGLAAALQVIRVQPVAAIREDTRGAGITSARQSWVRRGLVVSQVTASVVLLIGAGLFVRSLANLLAIEVGFASDKLLLAHVDFRPSGEESQRLYERAVERIAALPGVDRVSLSLVPPISGADGFWSRELAIDGRAQALEGDAPIFFNVVGPGFFDAHGTRLLRGRALSAADNASSGKVAVINETFARRYFGTTDVLGRRISVGSRPERQDLQIVGVAQDTKYQTLQEEPRTIAFLSYLQDEETAGTSAFTIEVRAERAPQALVASVEQAIRGVDALAPVRVELVEGRIDEMLWKERLLARIGVGVGVVAFFVAVVGVFAVMIRSVIQRAPEIGIRLMLGAKADGIHRLVLREALLLVGLGTIAGVAVAIAGGKFAESLLYGVRPSDPLTLASVATLMLVLGCLAGYLPARRVLRTNPTASLRNS